MADKMEFPKTMQEFIKNYSFKDSEEVYTNGSELIPTFRVEQAIEHYEIESNCKYWNAEHEDCALNYAEIRNNIIDEFAEKLKKKVEEDLSLQTFIDEDDLLDKDQVGKYIDEIAEEMRGAE